MQHVAEQRLHPAVVFVQVVAVEVADGGRVDDRAAMPIRTQQHRHQLRSFAVDLGGDLLGDLDVFNVQRRLQLILQLLHALQKFSFARFSLLSSSRDLRRSICIWMRSLSICGVCYWGTAQAQSSFVFSSRMRSPRPASRDRISVFDK